MSYERRGPLGFAIHPGEILREEFFVPLGLSGYALAKAIGVTPQRVNDIVLEKSGVSAEMALLLGKYFGTTAEWWMNMQSSYMLATAQKTMKKKVSRVKPHKQVA